MIAMLTIDEAKANISANVRRILKARGMTVMNLAKLTKEPQNSVYRVVRGDNEPGAVLLARIAEALDVSVDRLLSFPEKSKKSGSAA
jgi:transcriptional regulator with XRE-family HTH domain